MFGLEWSSEFQAQKGLYSFDYQTVIGVAFNPAYDITKSLDMNCCELTLTRGAN